MQWLLRIRGAQAPPCYYECAKRTHYHDVMSTPRLGVAEIARSPRDRLAEYAITDSRGIEIGRFVFDGMCVGKY